MSDQLRRQDLIVDKRASPGLCHGHASQPLKTHKLPHHTCSRRRIQKNLTSNGSYNHVTPPPSRPTKPNTQSGEDACRTGPGAKPPSSSHQEAENSRKKETLKQS